MNSTYKDPPQEKINQLLLINSQKNFPKLIEESRILISKYPNSFIIWTLFGIANTNLQKNKIALKAFKKATDLNPFDYNAFNNLGLSLKDNGYLEDAINSFERALKLKPDFFQTYYNLGLAYKAQGNLRKARKAYEHSLKLQPDYHKALNNLGNVLKDLNNFEEAIIVFKKSLSIKPNDSITHNNLAVLLKKKGDYLGALQAYDKAVSINPNYEKAKAERINLKSYIADWSFYNEGRQQISLLGISNQSIMPFSLLALDDSPKRHRLRSEIYAKAQFGKPKLASSFISGEKSGKIKIGYFSSDYKEHPVALLISKVIRLHNREVFDIYGYSLGQPKNDFMRVELVRSFDVFKDFHNTKNNDIMKVVREDKIDIAIDLTGYTQNSRTEIFSSRLAPIQINYLGYPGTMGSSFMDYIIADTNLIPKNFQKFYSEKPIYLPDQYQAQNDELPIPDQTPTRRELGLPEEGFIFCAINNSYKIGPDEFDIWMRLLAEVEGSVLWLLNTNHQAKLNLIEEAQKRGISYKRLVFANRVSYKKYLSQLRVADLFLDTFNYNAGATASNALWAGLPVLTKRGKSYTARMASSLLIAAGMSELVTENELEYEKLALALAQDKKLMRTAKQKLQSNKLSKPLFDTSLFTMNLEKGLCKAYENFRRGKKPEAIFVSDLG